MTIIDDETLILLYRSASSVPVYSARNGGELPSYRSDATACPVALNMAISALISIGL